MPKVSLTPTWEKQDLRFKELVAGRLALKRKTKTKLAFDLRLKQYGTITKYINHPDLFTVGQLRTLVRELGITPEELAPLIW